MKLCGQEKGRCGSFHLHRWQVKLRYPSLTHSMPDHLRDEYLMMKHYANLRLLYYYTASQKTRP